MKTKKEIIQAIVEEIPYRLDESIKPYIEEAMEIYAKQQVKDNVVLPAVINGFYDWHKGKGYITLKRDDLEEYLNSLKK